MKLFLHSILASNLTYDIIMDVIIVKVLFCFVFSKAWSFLYF